VVIRDSVVGRNIFSGRAVSESGAVNTTATLTVQTNAFANATSIGQHDTHHPSNSNSNSASASASAATETNAKASGHTVTLENVFVGNIGTSIGDITIGTSCNASAQVTSTAPPPMPPPPPKPKPSP